MTEQEIPEPAEMSNEKLMDEHGRMRRHEDAEVLTREQESYLNDLEEEMLKRMSVGGPHADYTGPDEE